MKVSFFVHNLSSNPIARVAPLASAIGQKYEVEVLGFLMDEDKVYKPYRERFEYKTIHTTSRTSELFPDIPRLAARATGDIIYACKPLTTSFAPALIAARLRDQKPLFLDVEDDDVKTAEDNWLDFIWIDLLRGWRLGTSWKYATAVDALSGWVDGVTVVSQQLQRRYGGSLLRHGPDENIFDPSRFDEAQVSFRKKWELPEEKKLALFVGAPELHKGLDTLAEALQYSEVNDWHLVLVGPRENKISQQVAETLGARCHRLGYQPYENVPEFLAMADAVPVPQKAVPYAKHQVPAKLLDALAMACPVIGTRVGDLPEILGHGQRGWLTEPERPEALVTALSNIANCPSEAQRRGQAGREWFLENASSSAIFSTLDAMFERECGKWS